MITQFGSYWQVWKWGVATVLFGCAMIAIFGLQYRFFQNQGDAWERSAGLSSPYSRPEIEPTAIPAYALEPEQVTAVSPGPMIIRAVSLSLTFKNFQDMRARIDDVMQRFHGYIDALTIRSDSGQPSSLAATLRIPADELQSALGEIKTFGNLIEESETGRDITAGYGDLAARLFNARRTEQRMLGLLSERVGKLGEVVEVEKQIGEVRERIERMEAQQRGLQNQVRFASVKLDLTEERQTQPLSVRTRLRTAIADGYRSAVENSIAVTLATLRYGPTAILYSLLLLPFIIVAWRRFHPKIA